MKSLITLLTGILFFTSLHAQLPSYLPTNGLVGWWPFNGNANDESGNGNDGTIYGAVPTYDREGNPNSAYFFNGINNSINTTLNNIPGNAYSITCWFKTQYEQSNEIGLVVSRSTIPPTGLYLYNNTQFLQSTSTCSSFHYHGVNTPSISDNQWHHYVGTFNGIGFVIFNLKGGIFNS
jgi:hypothetical protein